MFDTEKYDSGFTAALLDWFECESHDEPTHTTPVPMPVVSDDDPLAPWNLL